MSYRGLTQACAALALSATTAAVAVAEEAPVHSFSANLAVTSDYIWRGISQTDNEPAIQGGADYSHASGLYLGAWASNVDFAANDADVEVDLYGGFSNEVGGFSYDVGVIHYNYPGESDLNFEELYLGLGYGFLSVKASHDFDNENSYYEAGADFTLPAEVSLALHVGHYDFDNGEDYDDWKVAVGRSYGGFDFELAYADTDLSDNECGGDYCDARAIFTVSREF